MITVFDRVCMVSYNQGTGDFPYLDCLEGEGEHVTDYENGGISGCNRAVVVYGGMADAKSR